MRTATKRHSGFAMVTAIMLLSFVAMTITLFGITIFNQARRTQIVSEDAQLRQLLIAGTAFAETKISSDSPTDSSIPFSVPLPENLQHDSAELTVSIHAGSNDRKIAEIEASLPHHHLSEQLTFSSRNGAWQLTEANLGL